jgi:lipopolysaccharide biosynthesis glycosyltransferase
MKTALVLACDDNFIPFASVVARRVAYYAREKFPIVIVSDGVTDENKRLAQKFCPQISFIEASQLFGDRVFYTRANFTRAAYLRLFFDEILADFDRVAYIDCDVSPLTDLRPLLGMSPKASPIIAAYDLVQLYDDVIYDRLPLSREAGYFQSGVMVLDLKAIRAERIFKDTIQFVLHNPERCLLVDQDALNVVLNGRWQIMDWRWNVLHFCLHKMPQPYYIRHMTGAKPWSTSKYGIEKRLVNQWRDDLAGSPWPHKFLPNEDGWMKTHIRPVISAVERPIKHLRYAGAPDWRGRLVRYEKRIPALLPSIEEAASRGELAKALW